MSLLDSYTNSMIRKNVIRRTGDSVTPSGKLLQGWDDTKCTLLSEFGARVKKRSFSHLTPVARMHSTFALLPFSLGCRALNVGPVIGRLPRHLCFLSLAILLLTFSNVLGDTVVSPPENASAPGVGSQAPFKVDSTRILAVYPASDFLAAMPSGSLITQIAFRLDESIRNSVAVVIPDVEIRMSTTPSLVPNFGGHFSDIVGSDEVTVRTRGALAVKASFSHGGANPFTIVANLDHPFRYDPRQGNLAVDIFTYKAYSTSDPSQALFIDADNDHAKMFAGGGDLAIFTIPALIMQVTYSAIPEPSSALLIAAGASLMMLRIAFRKSAVVFNVASPSCPQCLNKQDSSGRLLQGWGNAKHPLQGEFGAQVKKRSFSHLTPVARMHSTFALLPFSLGCRALNVGPVIGRLPRHLCFLSLAILLLTFSNVLGDTVVSPPENASAPGVGSQAPFKVDSTRILAVYPASDFLAAMPSGSLITQIAFRLDESIRNSVAVVIPDVEIRMSTTPSLVPNFGGHFSDIVGSDEVTVRTRGALAVKASFSHSGANPFTIVANLDHPFRYDPRQGNLAIDIFTYTGYTTTDLSQFLLIDADNDHAKMFSGGGDLAIFTIPALIMQATYSAIPEPSSALLIAAGASLMMLRIAFRKTAAVFNVASPSCPQCLNKQDSSGRLLQGANSGWRVSNGQRFIGADYDLLALAGRRIK